MNRHLSRTIALQTLFELDFTGKEKKDALEAIKRNVAEFSPGGGGDFSFIKQLVEGILGKQDDLDDVIEKAAPDWPIDKIATVDRNILRLGLYELLFADRKEVPPKVAINEAIEIAKTFGGENSYKFVNGVLGAVYKQMGEPQKDEGGSSSNKSKEDLKNLPIEKLVGAVVYAKEDDQIYLALVHDIFGHWTLSKGKLEKGEDEKDGVTRGVKEEMSLGVEVEDELGGNEYVASDPEKGKIRKQVTYYLAQAPFKDIELGTSGGLDDAKWFKMADIVDLNLYDDVLPIFTKAVNILLNK